LDLVGLMTYDMHGTWETITGFNAPLYATAEDEATYTEHACSVEYAVNHWLDSGIDATKLVVGFGTYGRGWKLANGNVNGPLAPTNGASNPGPSANSGAGFMAYNEIQYLIDQGAATRYYDEAREVPYIVTTSNEWIGYDDEQSFTAKLAFLKSKGVRGAMVWSIDLDVLDGFPLLNVIRDSLADYQPLGPDYVLPPTTTTTTDSPADDDDDDTTNAVTGGTIRCGTDWNHAEGHCGVSCPSGTDAECPSGQTCFGDLTSCSGSDGNDNNNDGGNDNQGQTGGTIRCGTDWNEADGKCGVSCTTNADCPSGEMCWQSLSEAPCANSDNGNDGNSDDGNNGNNGGEQQNTGGTIRCGSSWSDAEGKCGVSCPSGTDAECPDGETCWADLTHCDGVQHPTPSPTDPAPVVTGEAIDNGAVNICYFTNWARYRSGLSNNGNDVFENGFDATLCTHINYGFGTIDPNTLAPKAHDPFADYPTGVESQDEPCPSFCVPGYSGSGCSAACAPDRMLRGFEGLTVGAKRVNPGVKAVLSIGGWNFNNCACDPNGSECPQQGSATCGIFSDIASTEQKSRTHAQHMIAFLRKWEFDGYDIDWEYPVVAGHNNVNGQAHPQDYDNYIRMLRIIREEFEAEAAQTGQTQLLLTAAVGVGKKTADQAYNIAEMNKYLDLVGLMTYDMHGTWETVTNFNAPLYTTQEDEEYYENACSVQWAVDYWLARGLDASKLVVGFGTYGRGWKLANANQKGVLAPTSGASSPGPSADSGPGFMAYYEIQYMIDNNLATRYWDEERKVPYIVTTGNDWIGYDDAESFEAKLAFLKARGVRGAMVWAIDLDELSTYPLLNVIRNSLANYNPVTGEDEVDEGADGSTTPSPADTDGEATSETENGGSNMLVAVLASSVVLVLCCVCACGCIFAGCVLFQQKPPSHPKMPEPSAPTLADSNNTQYDTVRFDCEDIKALKKQIARLEAAAARGTVEGSDVETGIKQEQP